MKYTTRINALERQFPPKQDLFVTIDLGDGDRETTKDGVLLTPEEQKAFDLLPDDPNEIVFGGLDV